MLYKFRTHHIKRILWILVIVVIPTFILWGGISYLNTRQRRIVGEIDNKGISWSKFHYYLRMADLYFYLFSPQQERASYDGKKRFLSAWYFLLLLWKADKENIKVKDTEVVNKIKEYLFKDREFNKEAYLNFLRRGARIPARVFEEYVRNFLKIDKLFQKYIKIDVSDEEIKEAYKKDTQKAKINYLFIPYNKFENKINITDEEIKDFYLKNKSLFKEEPKVKIKYIALEDSNPKKTEILKTLSSIKNIEELKERFSLEIKETGFIGLKDPIEGLGWYPQVNKISFSLKEKEISSPLKIKGKVIIIQKEKERSSFVPPLSKIKEKVKEKLKEEKLKEEVRKKGEEIIQIITKENIKDLRKIAKKEDLEFKETNYFKYYDYIEGLGLDEKISKIVFSLKKGEIYLSPLLLTKGGYIIQLKEITPFNEEDFKKQKDTYKERIYRSKMLLQKVKFISELEKEARLKIYPLQE
jgi:parvulin-like peptidyl-prolyl isomerase